MNSIPEQSTIAEEGKTATSSTARENRTAAMLSVGAVACFHAAFLIPALCWLILGFLACLFSLRRVGSARKAFYISLAIGIACYAPHMGFMWKIFKAAAIPLWLILPFFLAVFGLILWHLERRFGAFWCALLAPVLWTGVEYFRCEVWWLRFSWLSSGSAFRFGPALLNFYGVFGAGFLALAFAAFFSIGIGVSRLRDRILRGSIAALVGLIISSTYRHAYNKAGFVRVQVAALQLEFPSDPDVLAGLERIRKEHPDTRLIVLPEYTFDGPPPKFARDWCRTHGKWLIAGGKEDVVTETPAENSRVLALANPFLKRGGTTPFRNTAFVISTNGELVFTQAKSQPIQFFNDGLPAESQRVWESPWGRIGIAICYDASYRHVTDELICQGAQALIFPTMDVEEWGTYEHELNARQARLRATEYRVSVLRIASSGPSELIMPGGYVTERTEVPGQGSILAGDIVLPGKGGSLPADRWLAPACMWATGGIVLTLLAKRRRSDGKADSHAATDSTDSTASAVPALPTRSS